jgi:N-methylhydantoinase A
MRYVGQGHEIAVNLPVAIYGAEHGLIFRQAFEAAYTQLYGRTIDGIDIETLSWTLTISAPTRKITEKLAEPKSQAAAKPVAHQSFYDPARAVRVDVPVFLREHLRTDDHIDGPALITEDQTTTVVTSSYAADIDARGYIVLTRRGGRDDG